jgi:hypothetical protein
MIASIAIAQEASLVTGNTRHYERFAGLQLADGIRQLRSGSDPRAMG